MHLLSSEVGNPDFSIIFRTWNDSELSEFDREAMKILIWINGGFNCGTLRILDYELD